MVILASANITFFDSIIKQRSEKKIMILRKISLFYSNFALTIFAYNGKLFELFVFFTLLSFR